MEHRMLNWTRDRWDEHGNHYFISVDLKSITKRSVDRALDQLVLFTDEFVDTVPPRQKDA